MDLNAFLLDQLFIATTSGAETAAEAQHRREAINEMFQAFEPRDRMEASIAAHCVGLQFMMDDALRDSAKAGLEPAAAARFRAGATAISRTLFQWVSKLEKSRQQKLKQRTETPAAAANATPAEPPAPEAEPGAAIPPSPEEVPPAEPAAVIQTEPPTVPADPLFSIETVARVELAEAMLKKSWPRSSTNDDTAGAGAAAQ